MSTSHIKDTLAAFNPAKAGKYEPGSVVVFFDHRSFKSDKDKSPFYQNYWLDTKSRMGWASLWPTTDLEPGNLRLVFYTHEGNEGQREYPLHMAYAVKEMFDDLADEGFRPMIIGWSKENPFPMIGGSEPPAPPPKAKVRVTKTYSNAVSGHSEVAGNPHDRVMAIIDAEEAREAKQRARELEKEAETDTLV
ncbi:hypothetical protein AMS68_006127 [Peltaster fructicola]|uniref:Uncharacterized protein n=1 Tax=Peltaster fructicola TaxID=286661 RepID=A0A6H0Y1U0_9PEZI|nr:hypothetical protein AMS68_006127 [Peltaster fructicola]